MKLRLFKTALWFLVGLAAVVVALRILHGVGSVVALNNILPWGLWKGGGVVALVPIGGAGFTLAALVYVFHWKRYEPLARGAVLLGLMCYTSVAIGLTFDIGIWWRIVFPVFHWQLHSTLFEIAWCIMLYLGVLAVEFSHTVLERLRYPRLLKAAKKVTIVFVILGISLSTLHQSSLGTLFLATPFRLHPLWYSELLPLLFFVTSVGLGCLTISWTTLLVHWLYNAKPPMKAISGLGRIAAAVLALYVAIRFGDLLVAGKGRLLVTPDWDTFNFWVEIVLSAVVPIAVLSREKLRNNPSVVFWVSTTAVAAMSLNRINVAGLATLSSSEGSYFPVWPEWTVTLGIVAAAGLVFLFAVEHFGVFKGINGEVVRRTHTPDRVDPADWKTTYFMNPRADIHLYSAAMVVALGFAAGCLPDSAIYGATPAKTPTQGPKAVTIQRIPNGSEPGTRFVFPVASNTQPAVPPTLALLIDGDDNGRYVLFEHQRHVELLGDRGVGCADCHHMTAPMAEATSCQRCHSDMHLSQPVFNHRSHVQKLGGNAGCIECHKNPGLPKVKANTTSCESCHPDMHRKSALIEVGERKGRDPDSAPGYIHAMHKLCISCHEREQETETALNPELSQCVTCHRGGPGLAALQSGMRGHHSDPGRGKTGVK